MGTPDILTSRSVMRWHWLRRLTRPARSLPQGVLSEQFMSLRELQDSENPAFVSEARAGSTNRSFNAPAGCLF